MTTPALSLPRRHARLGRYALWQSGEFVMNVAIISLILFGLLGGLSIMQIHSMEQYYAMRRPPQPVPDMQKISIFLQIYGIFVTVGPIICLSGIVSQDRTMGYTRFLFSKPVSPRWFYLQSFVVRMLGFLVLGHALLFLYGAFEPPAYSPKFLADLVIAFLSYGGIIFLLSVVSRYDGLVAIVLFLVSAVVWGKWELATGFGHVLTYAFPPIEKYGDLHTWVVGLTRMGTIGAVEFPWKWAVWGTSYGLACLALGLYLLRRIPLTKP